MMTAYFVRAGPIRCPAVGLLEEKIAGPPVVLTLRADESFSGPFHRRKLS
jgi:hypothetical protein